MQRVQLLLLFWYLHIKMMCKAMLKKSKFGKHVAQDSADSNPRFYRMMLAWYPPNTISKKQGIDSEETWIRKHVVFAQLVVLSQFIL